MKLICAFFLAIGLAVPTAVSAQTIPALEKTNVLVITGGHGFEREPFFKVFSENSALACTFAEHAKAGATAWERDDLTRFSTVVLYDMTATITDAQKAKILSLFERGIGLVVLHHSLCSFQGWPDYERIIGGCYPVPPKDQSQVTDKIGYAHGVEVPVVIADPSHPITAGLKDFTIHDEIYWGFRVGTDVHPLLTTTLPKSGNPLMWTRAEGKSRVVFLQLGHDHFAYENPNFRQLVARSISWTAVR
ncbi:MAG: ThuA domain-containing protein [Verrucomicrobiota bacterium]